MIYKHGFHLTIIQLFIFFTRYIHWFSTKSFILEQLMSFYQNFTVLEYRKCLPNQPWKSKMIQELPNYPRESFYKHLIMVTRFQVVEKERGYRISTIPSHAPLSALSSLLQYFKKIHVKLRHSNTREMSFFSLNYT